MSNTIFTELQELGFPAAHAAEIIKALKHYVDVNGRSWRDAIDYDWHRAHYPSLTKVQGILMQRVRNQLDGIPYVMGLTAPKIKAETLEDRDYPSVHFVEFDRLKNDLGTEEAWEDFTERFIDGWKEAGGIFFDLENGNPHPWCCPWVGNWGMEVEGETPKDWGASYWQQMHHQVADCVRQELKENPPDQEALENNPRLKEDLMRQGLLSKRKSRSR